MNIFLEKNKNYAHSSPVSSKLQINWLLAPCPIIWLIAQQRQTFWKCFIIESNFERHSRIVTKNGNSLITKGSFPRCNPNLTWHLIYRTYLKQMILCTSNVVQSCTFFVTCFIQNKRILQFEFTRIKQWHRQTLHILQTLRNLEDKVKANWNLKNYSLHGIQPVLYTFSFFGVHLLVDHYSIFRVVPINNLSFGIS